MKKTLTHRIKGALETVSIKDDEDIKLNSLLESAL